jgi:hypothetical protein
MGRFRSRTEAELDQFSPGHLLGPTEQRRHDWIVSLTPGGRLCWLGQDGPEVHGDLGAVRGEQQALDILSAHARHVEITLEGLECQQTDLLTRETPS